MGKFGRFIHEAVDGTNRSVTGTFSANNRHDIITGGGRFAGSLDGIVLRLTNINQATKLVVKICHNSNGTGIVIPDTEAVIALEVGSNTEGGVAYQFDFKHVHTDDNFSIFYRTDAGTCTVDVVELYWSE